MGAAVVASSQASQLAKIASPRVRIDLVTEPLTSMWIPSSNGAVYLEHESLELRQIVRDAQSAATANSSLEEDDVDGQEEEEMDELAKLAGKILSGRTSMVVDEDDFDQQPHGILQELSDLELPESKDSIARIVSQLSIKRPFIAASTPVKLQSDSIASAPRCVPEKRVVFEAAGTPRHILRVQRFLGISLNKYSPSEAFASGCVVHMFNYAYGSRLGVDSIAIRLPSTNSRENSKAPGKQDAPDTSGGYQMTRTIRIKIIRRKKMNKHKWKKLRRKYRNSTRFSRSKRKKNREVLMKEYAELGLEFGRKN